MNDKEGVEKQRGWVRLWFDFQWSISKDNVYTSDSVAGYTMVVARTEPRRGSPATVRIFNCDKKQVFFKEYPGITVAKNEGGYKFAELITQRINSR